MIRGISYCLCRMFAGWRVGNIVLSIQLSSKHSVCRLKARSTIQYLYIILKSFLDYKGREIDESCKCVTWMSQLLRAALMINQKRSRNIPEMFLHARMLIADLWSTDAPVKLNARCFNAHAWAFHVKDVLCTWGCFTHTGLKQFSRGLPMSSPSFGDID